MVASKSHFSIISLSNVIADKLHLLLRITDKLLQNVVDEILERDALDDFDKARGQPKGIHLAKLVKAINDLGIPFSVWNKKNADGSESNVKEFTKPPWLSEKETSERTSFQIK